MPRDPSFGQRATHGVPALASCVVLAACGASTPAANATAVVSVVAATAMTAMVAPQVDTLPDGVSAESNACVPGRAESCDGRDADCDGHIDEGCGWDSGSVQITLAWDSGADLDLYMVDPSGFTISNLDRISPTGGELDRDARGACVPGAQTMENVRWTAPRPPSGSYRVDVHYWGDCGVARSTRARVSVSVAGRVLGTYAVVLELGQRRTVVAFTL